MNSFYKLILVSFFLPLSSASIFAQNSDFIAEISSTVITSSEDEIPFWLRANTGFEFSNFTNFAGAINGAYSYNFEKFTLEGGAYIFARDGVDNNVQRRDLYLQFRNNWLKVTAGAKQRDEAFFGLSSTNQNYLLSNNARPLPGLIIEANEPLTLFKGLKLDWGIAHYQLNDDRFVDGARVHYKRLNVITQLSENSKVTLGIQHFAQWAGTSPRFGELKSDAGAFWNVFIANRATELGEEGEIENAVGNHLGTFLFRYDLQMDKGEFAFYHEHPFEDGSGTRFQNFPDGVWGLTYKPDNSKIINGFLYEYTDTRSQSGDVNNSGRDNYFENRIYPGGWTYEENIIGTPFYKTDNSGTLNGQKLNIVGSRFQVHHLGVIGQIQSINWKLKTSYSKNLGTYSEPFEIENTEFYSSAEVQYIFKLKHELTIMTGMDISNVTSNIFGAGVTYKYTF